MPKRRSHDFPLLRRSQDLPLLVTWLSLAVVVELLVLRTGTRTLIHIPGLDRYGFPIGVMGEIGRVAYYLAALLVVVVLSYVASRKLPVGLFRNRALGVLIVIFLAGAGFGRLGWLESRTVGWVSLCVMAGVVSISWRGIRSIPLMLFVMSAVFAATSVLGQGPGGGVSAQTVDGVIVTAEALLILAGVTSPLLLDAKVPRIALVTGVVVLVLYVSGAAVGGSTLAILTLWNLGVPGWMSPVAYGLAFGGLAVTLTTAVVSRLPLVMSGVILMVGAGVGMISTYQTALAIAAVTILGMAGVVNTPRDQHEIETDGHGVIRHSIGVTR